MTISTRHLGGITIVDINGQIVLGNESGSMRDMIHDLLSKGHKRILLNFGAVDCIDTRGLGALAGAFTTVRKEGGELKLLNLPEKVADVMEVTKLSAVFDILNDEAQAVKSFNQATVMA